MIRSQADWTRVGRLVNRRIVAAPCAETGNAFHPKGRRFPSGKAQAGCATSAALCRYQSAFAEEQDSVADRAANQEPPDVNTNRSIKFRLSIRYLCEGGSPRVSWAESRVKIAGFCCPCTPPNSCGGSPRSRWRRWAWWSANKKACTCS